MRFRHFTACVLFGVIGLSTIVGCSSGDDPPNTFSRDGRVTSIDHATRQVTMLTKDKRGEEMSVSGTYNDETSVIINGRNMTVKDIREGDAVKVVGRREGEGTNQRLIATEVIVTRYEGDWQDTGKSERDGTTTSPAAEG